MECGSGAAVCVLACVYTSACQTLRSNTSPSIYLYLHANVSLMQNSRRLRGSFFSLELVKSLKTKSKAVPRVHRVCFAPGSWASSRTENPKSSDLTLKGEQRRCLEGGRPLAELRMSAGRPARLSAHALSAVLTPPLGAGQAGPKMAALRYRRFLKLCEEWPVDETKRGRDLGAYLRQRVAQAFREGENTQVTGGKEVGDVGTRGGRVGILRMRRPP